jgi:hypothetical protein
MFLPEKRKNELLLNKELKERRERTLEVKYGFDRRINILRLPKVKIWESNKMLEPATEKQIKWLRDVGIWQPEIEYTKKQASELISNLPAEKWQVRFLAQHRYDISHGATIGQFQKVKKMLEERDKFRII